jgi:hypothetical protein
VIGNCTCRYLLEAEFEAEQSMEKFLESDSLAVGIPLEELLIPLRTE